MLGFNDEQIKPGLLVPVIGNTYAGAAMIGLTAMFLGGFVVDGLWAGIGAAIVTGVVSWLAGAFIGGGDDRRAA